MKKSARLVALAIPALLMLAACAKASVTDNDHLTIQGSDTEVQLVSTLVEEFAKTHPGADVSVAGGGSAVGIAALINGETDIANSSRQMKADEVSKAKEKGRTPQEFILARDGLSIVVHPSNPLTSITLDQLGKIFRGEATNWKDVGGPDAPIVLYGRQSTSGTFSFFRDTAVKGDYAATLRQMEGSQAIVDAVRSDAAGIGYVGVGYVKTADGKPRADVKVVPVAATAGGTAYSPLDRAAVENETYPIARRIFQYLPDAPTKDSLAAQFLEFEASSAGQAIIEKGGFYGVIAPDKAKNDAFFAGLR